jgi:hypothetical protein
MTAYLEPGALAVSLGTSLAPPDAVESGDLHQVAVRIKRVRAPSRASGRSFYTEHVWRALLTTSQMVGDALCLGRRRPPAGWLRNAVG